jgi:hypothetical protein
MVQGILAVCPADERPKYIANKRELHWPNGSKSLLFSAEEPDRLRGKIAPAGQDGAQQRAIPARAGNTLSSTDQPIGRAGATQPHLIQPRQRRRVRRGRLSRGRGSRGERKREHYALRLGVFPLNDRYQIIKPALRFVVPFNIVHVVYVDGGPDLPDYCRRFHCGFPSVVEGARQEVEARGEQHVDRRGGPLIPWWWWPGCA